MWTKYLLKLKYCGYNLKKNNILSKRIFSLWFFLPWSHFGRQRWHFLDFEDRLRATSGLFSNDLVEWQRTRVVVLLSFTELAERFDEALEALFPVRSYFWIFSLGFFFFGYFFLFLISSFFLIEDTSIYRWR